MVASEFLRRWSHPAYRIIPDSPLGAPRNDPLDPSFAALSDENRWNARGAPTLYFAGDVQVLAGEWARHVKDAALTPPIVVGARPRRIYRVHLNVDQVLDLRDAHVTAALGVSGAPSCFLDKRLCRELARDVRERTDARALLVPSVAFLDQLDRWVMVLFVDKLPSFPAPFVTNVQKGETLPGAL